MSTRRRVLVTGGAGFIGSHLVDRALAEGCEVVVLDNLYTGHTGNIAHHDANPYLTFVHHDVREPLPESILDTGKVKFSYIFHMACPASPVHYQTDPIATTLTCVNGTLHMLQLATSHNCPVVIGSTSEVYGDPLVHPQVESYWGNVNCTGVRSCYDEGKRCAESLAFDFGRHHGTKIRVARIFNTYGPRMCFDDGRVVSNFLVQALKGDDITIYGTGRFTRSFQYVDDLVEALWRFANHPDATGPLNIGNQMEYTIEQLAEKVLALVPESSSKVVYLPVPLDDPQMRRPDITAACDQLGWAPQVELDVGLQRTLTDFRVRLGKGET